MNIAVYFDLENITNFSLCELMRILDDNGKNNITVKIAVGNSASITNYREELKNQNFTIIEAPHIVKKKNRADIILSVIAYEDFFCHKPEIDQFVFIASDSDYTFIMDKLKRQGKIIWLVCKEDEKEKEYFRTCTNKIISIEEIKIKKTLDELKKWLQKQGFNESDFNHLINYFNNEWKNSEKLVFNYNEKKIKNLKVLLSKLTEEHFLDIKKEGKNSLYKIIAV
ncbi:MAG: NYN domain-containing protein [Treponema sp.]|nr:NYN domain-containing protein [Treponema sp.]MCL2251452.1 NYN domain-containing protein [Treponema sp.]